MREGRSPNYFNPTEAVLVLDYISRLLGEGVRPEDNTRKTKANFENAQNPYPGNSNDDLAKDPISCP